MFRLYSEWDIGETNLVFASKEAGLAWLRTNPDVAEMAAEDKQTIDECIYGCFYDGYFNWETLEVIA